VKLKAACIFVPHFCLQMTNLAIWALLVFILGMVKLLLPNKFLQRFLLNIMHCFYLVFGRISVLLIKLFNNVSISHRVHGTLSQNEWYLLLSNHLSYLDIILLIDFSANRIPVPKFFLKKELIWLPFVGIAAWALDMPFMKRYSKAFLLKHPHLKGKDIETTKKSCEKYKHKPTTVINFVEGTRFTQTKHKNKQSPYAALLPPKAGGVAFSLAAMGDLFTHILDITLVYPDNDTHPMLEMLCGDMKTIIIDVSLVSLPDKIDGDYANDESYRRYIQNWLNSLWKNKDARLQQLSH
jgi:1-acyl-sn-glycerol-3-phosphate acyltransferase